MSSSGDGEKGHVSDEEPGSPDGEKSERIGVQIIDSLFEGLIKAVRPGQPGQTGQPDRPDQPDTLDGSGRKRRDFHRELSNLYVHHDRCFYDCIWAQIRRRPL